ncbi:molybdenum cofactor biosynthesis F family protein [Kocuria sp. LUK]|uniref:MoaF C-terminal domain-containing protein n=1 Tax=Kocuria sp. LUK TaxID=2897828 RepID=UPI001E3E18BE|nr:MoaF C-terminal domain-containing protein [Kocuria sp. LUK]MCD1145363.1 molybdenum cofactor biosynthesis F family protein [Kocuria sp. LUK]
MTTDSAFQDYVPVDEWPSVSTMLDGFGDQTLPASPALAGSSLALHGEDGRVFTLAFHDATSLTWTTSAGGSDDRVEATYKAIEARPGIFIVDVTDGAGRQMRDITVVLNRNTGAATVAVSALHEQDGAVKGSTEFTHARLEGTEAAHHRRSAGLVGKRIYYRYSDVEAYEHIYLTPGTFVWHCLRGGEKGLADVDRTLAFEVAEDLYLFFWTERVMTVESVLLVDLREQRSIGRMFGWDDTTDEPLVLPFNSRLTVMNTTEYPQDHHKH